MKISNKRYDMIPEYGQNQRWCVHHVGFFVTYNIKEHKICPICDLVRQLGYIITYGTIPGGMIGGEK